MKRDRILISAHLSDPGPHLDHDSPRELVVTRLAPMRMKKSGVELRLVLDGSPGSARRDLTLLKAIARGRQWFEDLVSGKAESISAVSRRERLAVRHVSRIIRLAFLAPDVVEGILGGRQPPLLTAQELLHRRELPARWSERKTLSAS